MKRKIFYQCYDWLINHNRRYLILTGPPKCGKTVCLEQIKEEFDIKHSYNFKELVSDEERRRIMEDIVLPATEGIFLLDEITYLPYYMNYLYKIDCSIIENRVRGIDDTRKIIVTGNHAYAINHDALLAVATNADYVSTSFIDFEEWLLYRKRISNYGEKYSPTVHDLKDYICNSSEFSGIYNNLEYIQSCIDANIISNKNSKCSYRLVPNDVIEAGTVLNVLYSSTSDTKILRAVTVLLEQLNLITITCPLISKDSKFFYHPFEIIKDDEIIRKCSICVKHPILYTNMIKEINPEFDNGMEYMMGDHIYESVIECLLKELLSYSHTYRSNVFDSDINWADDIQSKDILELILHMSRGNFVKDISKLHW
jgi:hypothetical protein